MLLKLEKRSIPSKGNGKLAVSSRIHRKPLKIPSKKHPGKLHPGLKSSSGKKNLPRPTTSTLQCDNSNDSGLGFDHHLESHYNNSLSCSTTSSSSSHTNGSTHYRPLNSSKNRLQKKVKRVAGKKFNPALVGSSTDEDETECTTVQDRRPHNVSVEEGQDAFDSLKNPIHYQNIDVDDACDDDYFFLHAQKNIQIDECMPTTSRALAKLNSDSSSSIRQQQSRTVSKRSIMSPTSSTSPSTVTSSTETPPPSSFPNDLSTAPLYNQYQPTSRSGYAKLEIETQPEQQHRARYQTEGSRGAVKDRSGNGFPVVKLKGYNKPTTLQVFIGTDVGKCGPHIFYQACKVSGKNSTPCSETKIEGTMVIEIEMKPENDMTIICDCVGILKERNVDVEHRFPNQSTSRNKKKSTKCRMVFRTKINDDEFSEILQVCSQPITCTQPPGIPEISKKSLHSCAANGGQELFIIGKNFLKDTKVIFMQYSSSSERTSNPKLIWEEIVTPDKEYLQQTHLICVVPAYVSENITESVNVQICVISSNKKSESHNFLYTPRTENSIERNNNNNCNNNFNYPTQANQDANKKDFQQIFVESSQTNQQNKQQQQQQNNVLMHYQKSSSTDLSDLMMPPPPPSSSVPLNTCNTNNLSVTSSNCQQNLQGQELTQNSLTEPPISLKSEYIEENVQSDNIMDSCTSSPTVSTTSQALVPSDLLYEQKPAPNLPNYPLLNNNTILQNSFVPSTANQNAVDIMQNQNFLIKNEEIQQEQSPQHMSQSQLTSQLNQSQLASQLNQNQLELASQLNQSQLAATPLTPHEQQQVNFLNNFGQVSQNNDGLFQNTQQLTDNLMFSSQQQQQQQQNLNNTTTTTSQLMAQNSLSQMLENFSSSITTQDIILNSRSSVVLNNSANVQKQQPTDQPMPEAPNMSSNIILNTTISPSMMCQNEQNLLAQVPMETNPILINNIIQSIPIDNATVDNSSGISTDSIPTQPVAVKNMILNAAAEILNTPSEAQSVVNALMNTLENAEPCMEVTQTHTNMHQRPMIYSTEMPPPPLPQPRHNNNQSMNDINMSLMAHKINIANKQDATNSNLMKPLEQHAQQNRINKNNQTHGGLMTDNGPTSTNSTNTNTTAISQPFSPTTQDLTTMSDNDLISFINPTIFGENII